MTESTLPMPPEMPPPAQNGEAKPVALAPVQPLPRFIGGGYGAQEDAVIMMVDDEPLNVEMTQAFLEDAGYRQFISTSESEKALDMMREHPPHVLLLDLMMPKVSGLQILSAMQQDKQLLHIPVIVLTSTTDTKTKLAALDLGAMDFLAKPVDASELALRLRNTLAARAYQDHLANHDALTGLPNRQRCKARVEAALQMAVQKEHGGALLYIGVDRLAQVNEALGRAVGDTLIYRVAKRLRQCVDTEAGGELSDDETGDPSLYRFDGDEFAILVPYVDQVESTAGFVSKLLEYAAVSLRTSEQEVFVTCSMGVAMFPDDGSDFDTLVSNAGIAMRHAKQSGRNTYGFFSSELNDRAMKRLNLGGDLRRALERDELSLHYQPRMDVRTGRIHGAEAVVHWNHPRGEQVAPEQVLALADSAGIVMAMGEWMLEQLTSDFKSWHRAHLPLIPVGVNVSLEQFRHAQLVEVIHNAVRAGLPPEFVCLELNEASTIGSAEDTARALAEIKEMGLRLALDDFGAGYSSLSHLRRFPLDELKIASSFLVNIYENKDNAAIVSAMIAMAHSLNLKATATGVTTPQQLAFLKNKDCDYGQGTLFSGALPAKEFAAKWLDKG